jgi:hypothetical protein
VQSPKLLWISKFKIVFFCYRRITKIVFFCYRRITKRGTKWINFFCNTFPMISNILQRFLSSTIVAIKAGCWLILEFFSGPALVVALKFQHVCISLLSSKDTRCACSR